jgi:hypothetical protein
MRVIDLVLTSFDPTGTLLSGSLFRPFSSQQVFAWGDEAQGWEVLQQRELENFEEFRIVDNRNYNYVQRH